MVNIKRNIIAVAFIGLLLLGVLPMVMAEGNDRSRQKEQERGIPGDVDEDGYLSLREFYALVNGKLDEDQTKRLFNYLDKDEDGKLSQRELMALETLMKERVKEQEKERKEAQKERKEQAREKVKERKEDQKERKNDREDSGPKTGIDLDNDGFVSLREYYNYLKGKMTEDQIKRIFNAADKDADGKLSKREFTYSMELVKKALQQGKTQQASKRNNPDQDGDGYISLREYNRFLEGKLTTEQITRIFNAADKNADGKLSKREFGHSMQLVHKVIKNNRNNQQNQPNGPDLDGDGYISLREFYALFNGQAPPQFIERLFNAADKDNDGKLSQREFLWAMEVLKNLMDQDSEEAP